MTKRAVIDIGSNSVRLVIYDGYARAKFAICNEKSLCGLGRLDRETGCLDKSAVADALAVLTRFRRLLREHGDPPFSAIATAAVREAKDGAAFIKKVNSLGLNVSVLSGDEEAVFAAEGVLYFEPTANGIVGDMGGGSLELAVLKNGAVKNRISLPLGPLSLARLAEKKKGTAADFIEAELARVDFFSKKNSENLYIVGGAWRALARTQLNLRGYPLPVLHHYEMTRPQTEDVCDLVSGLSRRSLEEIPGVSRRRIDTLPAAATVLKILLQKMAPKKIVVSAGGVREGLLYNELTAKERAQDPFLEAARFYGVRMSPQPKFGAVALKTIKPLFPEMSANELRLLKAAASMIDIAAFMHPDLRASHAFDTVMWAPFPALSHKDRVWTAMALYQRYRATALTVADEAALSILDWSEQESAYRVGQAMRFCGSFSPKALGPLKQCTLSMEDGALVFRAPKDRQELVGNSPLKRLVSLASSFGVDYQLDFF